MIFFRIFAGMIDRETVDRIYAAANIVDIIGDYVTLKRKGVNYQACCPFHNEKTPSFVVSPSKGVYKCFGCGKGGNAVTFLMEHENITYPEALKMVAKRYGIEVREKELTEEELAPYVEAVSVYGGLFQETGLRFSQDVPIHVHCVFQRVEVRVLLHLAEMLEGRVFLLLHLRFWLHGVEVLLQLYVSPFLRTHTLCVVPISTLPQLSLFITLDYRDYANDIQCRLLRLKRDFGITDGYS